MISLEIENTLKEHLNYLLPHHVASETYRYAVLPGGKLFRPHLVWSLFHDINPNAYKVSLQIKQKTKLAHSLLASAVEFHHSYTLIHDDLPCMDDDDFRRGMLSNHKKFGEALALLAGDGLMALAVEVFLESPVSPSLLLQGLKRMAWAMGPRGVIGGQAAESLLGAHSKFEDLRAMHRQKTGTLFSAALLIPKDFANLNDETKEGQALIAFADALGFAFQIADDLEDPVGQSVEHTDEMQNATHILKYLSKKDAQELVKKSLNVASDGLIALWGEKARPLIQVADEVILKSLI